MKVHLTCSLALAGTLGLAACSGITKVQTQDRRSNAASSQSNAGSPWKLAFHKGATNALALDGASTTITSAVLLVSINGTSAVVSPACTEAAADSAAGVDPNSSVCVLPGMEYTPGATLAPQSFVLGTDSYTCTPQTGTAGLCSGPSSIGYVTVSQPSDQTPYTTIDLTEIDTETASIDPGPATEAGAPQVLAALFNIQSAAFQMSGLQTAADGSQVFSLTNTSGHLLDTTSLTLSADLISTDESAQQPACSWQGDTTVPASSLATISCANIDRSSLVDLDVNVLDANGDDLADLDAYAIDATANPDAADDDENLQNVTMDADYYAYLSAIAPGAAETGDADSLSLTVPLPPIPTYAFAAIQPANLAPLRGLIRVATGSRDLAKIEAAVKADVRSSCRTYNGAMFVNAKNPVDNRFFIVDCTDVSKQRRLILFDLLAGKVVQTQMDANGSISLVNVPVGGGVSFPTFFFWSGDATSKPAVAVTSGTGFSWLDQAAVASFKLSADETTLQELAVIEGGVTKAYDLVNKNYVLKGKSIAIRVSQLKLK